MPKFVSFNHQIQSASETALSAVSSAALYGKGVFTTLAIYHGKPFLWEKHWRRLSENAEKIGIDLSEFSEASVKNSLAEIIKKNALAKGRARLTFWDESPSRRWSFESAKSTSLLITTAELREVSAVKLTVSPFRINSTSPLANIKSGNYLENLLALEEARKRGFDEAIRVNEKGEISAVCLANIFWLKDEKFYTPSLKTGCLAGTMREFLLENFEVFEVEQPLTDLTQAEMIFLTSAGLEMVRAKSLDNQLFGSSAKFSKLEADFSKLLKSLTEIEPIP
jgi:branched-subunit amino acid aminotransferase/4-amino-4-deoxychorismate lyase